jgi:hypothetical protein
VRLLLCAIALAATTACTSDTKAPSAPSAPSTPTVTAVELAVQNTLLRANETTQVSATATLSNGQTQQVTAGFRSDTPSVATVSDAGLVTALGEGRANIFVVYQGKQGLAQVRVMGSPFVITFTGFAGFGSGAYVEGGATITPLSGGWTFNSYGNPGPATVFPGFAFNAPAASGELAVTFGGGLFTFAAVDLYSSVTPIPWEFTGYRKDVVAFTAGGQQGNTFGRFVTTANPRASESIDRLVIKLTQPVNTSCAACGSNPMGLDNIVIY